MDQDPPHTRASRRYPAALHDALYLSTEQANEGCCEVRDLMPALQHSGNIGFVNLKN